MLLSKQTEGGVANVLIWIWVVCLPRKRMCIITLHYSTNIRWTVYPSSYMVCSYFSLFKEAPTTSLSLESTIPVVKWVRNLPRKTCQWRNLLQHPSTVLENGQACRRWQPLINVNRKSSLCLVLQADLFPSEREGGRERLLIMTQHHLSFIIDFLLSKNVKDGVHVAANVFYVCMHQ